MHSKNSNECEKSRIKGTPEYRLTKSKGLSLVDLVNLLKKIDEKDDLNITSQLGRQQLPVPLWRRSQKKRKRVNDALIIIDGKKVSSSEPKRSRRN